MIGSHRRPDCLYSLPRVSASLYAHTPGYIVAREAIHVARLGSIEAPSEGRGGCEDPRAD